MREIAQRYFGRAVLAASIVFAFQMPAVARLWTSGGSGVFKIDGELISYDGKVVNIQTAQGPLKFPATGLSEADQAYLKSTYPNGKADESAPKPDAKAKADVKAAAKDAKTTTKAKATKAKAKAADTKLAKATPRAEKPAEDMPEETPAEEPAAPAEPAESAGSMTVEVVGLSVIKPVKTDAEGRGVPGTQLLLMLSDESRELVSLDATKSKITACTDDQGTNLTKAAGKRATRPAKLALEVGSDGNTGLISIKQPQVPASGATKIMLKGELHVECSSGEDGAQTETVKVPVNLEVSLGL